MRPIETTNCTGPDVAALPSLGSSEPTSADLTVRPPGIGPFWTSGAFAFLLIVGTGGVASSASAASAVQDLGLARTGSVCTVATARLRRDDEDITSGSPEGLPFSQHHLSLNMSDLAAVLRVSRPTIYAWLRNESDPQTHNIARMVLLHELARTWSAMSPHRLGVYLKRPALRSRSVFDLLCEEHIDRSAVRDALASIARMIEGEPTRPRSAGEVAKQFGLRSQSKKLQEESVAQETGL